jgi:hypothetical protein
MMMVVVVKVPRILRSRRGQHGVILRKTKAAQKVVCVAALALMSHWGLLVSVRVRVQRLLLVVVMMNRAPPERVLVVDLPRRDLTEERRRGGIVVVATIRAAIPVG